MEELNNNRTESSSSNESIFVVSYTESDELDHEEPTDLDMMTSFKSNYLK